jgi:dipeptidyl aminopeptidase/acylaminoacyl peptidase
MGKSVWGLLAAALVVGVFKVGPYLLREAVIRETATTPADMQFRPTTIPTFDTKVLGLATWQQPAKAEKKDAQPAPAKAAALIRQWSVPSDEKSKPDDLLNPGRILDLAFDRDGTRLVAVARRGVHVWDVATGTKERSFLTTDRFPAVVSRDARFAAVPTMTDVTIFEAATGRVAVRYQLEQGKIHKAYWARGGGAFSASGEFYLAGVMKVADIELVAISTATGAAGTVPTRTKDPEARINFEQIEPIPGGTKLLLVGRVGKFTMKKESPVVTFDPSTGSQFDLASLPFRPWTLSHRGIRVSNDGLRVVAHDDKVLTAVARVTDKEAFTLKEQYTQFSDPVFTPDGKRVVVVRHAQYRVIHIGTNAPDDLPPDTIELLDAKAGTRLGTFAPERAGFAKRLTTVEVSHDGTTVAVVAGTRVGLVDFEKAFGVTPLPPIALPTEAEAYPVK